jgi:hypothetical protein
VSAFFQLAKVSQNQKLGIELFSGVSITQVAKEKGQKSPYVFI